MSDQLKSSIVRIRSSDGEIVGAGFLVDGRHVITCAHVVDGALKRKFNSPKQPTTSIFLDFFNVSDAPLKARVIAWRPYQPNKGGDIAVLELKGNAKFPTPSNPAKFLKVKTTTNLWGHPFRVFGFPEKREDRGVWAKDGIIRDRNILGWLQIDHISSPGYNIRPGFSGAPVWDDTLKAVVGMIVQTDEKPETAFVIPTDLLVEVWPEFASSLVDPVADYRDSLDTQYVNLSGILPLDSTGGEIESRMPLDEVYIRLQAIEREQQRIFEKQEQDRLEQENLTSPSKLGEDKYRRDKAYREWSNRTESQEARKEHKPPPKPVDPQEVLKEDKQKQFVVLGEPGAGKSTLLRYLARRAAKDENGPVPLLVPLARYAAELTQKTTDLREFALKQAAGDDEALYQLLANAVEKHNILWLLDALDEAQAYNQLEKVAEEVGRLRGLGPLILTSRLGGYTDIDPIKNMSHFEILPLGSENVNDFLHNWFSVLAARNDLSDNWVKKQVDQLKEQLDKQPGLQPLVGNPLLLTILVILAEENPAQELPVHRADLYDCFISKLLDRWEKSRPAVFEFKALAGNKKEARRAVKAGFHYLGWRLHSIYFGGQSSPIPNRETLTQDLKYFWRDQYLADLADEVIDFWMAAGLFERQRLKDARTRKEEEFLAFRHLTFQEYAAAEYLLREWEENLEQTWQFVYTHLHHYAWQEPILLLAGRMEPKLLNDLLQRLCRASRPFSRLTHRALSWSGRISVILLGLLVIWPLGLALLMVLMLTMPVWLPVAIFVETRPQKLSDLLLLSNPSIAYHFTLIPCLFGLGLADEILKAWRNRNANSSSSRFQNLFRSVRDSVGGLLGYWFVFWLNQPIYLTWLARCKLYANYLRRSTNNQKEAVAAALQREVLQAAAIIGDNSGRVEPAMAQAVAGRLLTLMRSDIPALTLAAAQAAANIHTGKAAGPMRAALIKNLGDDFACWHWYNHKLLSAAAYVLVRCAETKKLTPEMAKALLQSIGANPEINWTVGGVVDILSCYNDPAPELLAELASVFTSIINKKYYDLWRPDTITLRIAQNLTRWGKASPAAISILKSNVRGHSPKVDKGTLPAIEQGFLKGQIPVEVTQSIIEGLVRLVMFSYRDDEEGAKKALQAALSSAQSLPEVSSIVIKTMIGLPETEGVIDYRVARHLLAEALAGGAVSSVVFEVFMRILSDENYITSECNLPPPPPVEPNELEEGFGDEDDETFDEPEWSDEKIEWKQSEIRERVVLTLKEALINENLQAADLEILHLLLKAIHLKAIHRADYYIKRIAVEAINQAIQANKIRGELVEELEPFWAAARDELKKPEKYPSRFIDRGTLTEFTVDALIHLIDIGELPFKLLPPAGFDDVSEDIKKSYISSFHLMLRLKVENGQLQNIQRILAQLVNETSTPVFKSNIAYLLCEAIGSGGGISESVSVFQSLVDDTDPWVRSPAIRGLGFAIAKGLADVDLLPMVIDGLEDVNTDVQESAAKALTAVVKAGKATYAVAEALYQVLPIVEIGTHSELFLAIRYILAAGFGWPEWLDALVNLYDEVEKIARTGYKTEVVMTQTQVVYALAGAAEGGLINSTSVKVLLQAMESNNIGNKGPLITGLGYVLKAGWTDPNIVTMLRNVHGDYECQEKAIWAMCQAYPNLSLRETVIPILVDLVESRGWRGMKAVADLAGEIAISSPELMEAALQALKNEPEMGDAVRLIGRLSWHQPILLNDLKIVVDGMSHHVPPVEWEEHMQGLGYIIQNEHCSPEILNFVVAIILSIIKRYSFEEVNKPAAEALVAAKIIKPEEFEALAAAIRSDEDWQSSAQIIGYMINQDVETAHKLLSGFYYILQDQDNELFHHSLKKRVAQLLGYIDSNKNTQILLETLGNKSADRWEPFKVRSGAAFGLAQIGRRHPDRRAEITEVFNKVFYNKEEFAELEDNPNSLSEYRQMNFHEDRYKFKCAIVQAIGDMQDMLPETLKLLQDAAIYRWGIRMEEVTSESEIQMQIYAAEAMGKLNFKPDFSAEITNTLLLALANPLAGRNAVWESLNRLEQKAQEDL